MIIPNFFNLANMHDLKGKTTIFKISIGIKIFEFSPLVIWCRDMFQCFISPVFIFK